MHSRAKLSTAFLSALAGLALTPSARADWMTLRPNETIEGQGSNGVWRRLPPGPTRYRITSDGELQLDGPGPFDSAKFPRGRSVRSNDGFGHTINLINGGPNTPTDDRTDDEFRRLRGIAPVMAAADGAQLFAVHSGADAMLAEQMGGDVLGFLGVTRSTSDSILLLGSLTADGQTPTLFELGADAQYTMGFSSDLPVWTVGPGDANSSDPFLLLNSPGDTGPNWLAVGVPSPGALALMCLGGLTAARRRR
jgi:hypothetical protein